MCGRRAGRGPTASRRAAGWRTAADGGAAGVTHRRAVRAEAGRRGAQRIGGHVRHCLDHVEALLRGAGDGLLDYDRRERGTDVERSRTAALETIRRQERQLLEFTWPSGHRPLRLSVLVSPDAPPSVVLSSLDRELAFALSHTIHHGALIAVMAKLLGVAVPADFGYAPSTLAHGRRAECAR